MKLLMIDQCITQGGRERGGGQVGSIVLKKNTHTTTRELCGSLEKRGTEKCRKTVSVVGERVLDSWLTHTQTHAFVHAHPHTQTYTIHAYTCDKLNS